MTIVLAGGSGFLGSKLAARLQHDRHRVVILTRRPRPGRESDVGWHPDGSAGSLAGHLDGVDAVVNLAGEGIADRRWSAARKAAIRNSRLMATRTLVRAMATCQTPPRVFVSASGVGYYGARGDEPVTENTPPGSDFLAHLCVEWEEEARGAKRPATRVAMVRSGLVLDAKGGALPRMLPPFRFGLGATIGSGQQGFSWIHVADWVSMVLWLIQSDHAAGPFNATAPQPVTNRDLTQTLGRVLKRPAVLRAPAFVLRLALGEMSHMLITGQRALPARAEELGFKFGFRALEPALQDILGVT
jgi:uncharacterized protein (TIGR01777 family)